MHFPRKPTTSTHFLSTLQSRLSHTATTLHSTLSYGVYISQVQSASYISRSTIITTIMATTLLRSATTLHSTDIHPSASPTSVELELTTTATLLYSRIIITTITTFTTHVAINIHPKPSYASETPFLTLTFQRTISLTLDYHQIIVQQIARDGRQVSARYTSVRVRAVVKREQRVVFVRE